MSRLLLTPDRALDAAANYLATRPNLSIALVFALVAVVGAMEGPF